jgi:hypothetical protein
MVQAGSTKAADLGEEMAALVSTPMTAAASSSRTRVKQFVMILLAGCVALFLWDSINWKDDTGEVSVKMPHGKNNTSHEETVKPNDTATATTSAATPEPAAAAANPAPTGTPTIVPRVETIPSGVYSKACEKQCKVPLPRDDRFGGEDLTLAATMLKRWQKQRQNWIDHKLKKQYGEAYYADIFEPVLDGEQRVFVGREQIFKNPNALNGDPREPGPGWARMVRKYQIKILQIQLAILQEQLTPKLHCHQQCQAELPEGLYSRFTWVNGGHSASAGHGNCTYPSLSGSTVISATLKSPLSFAQSFTNHTQRNWVVI